MADEPEDDPGDIEMAESSDSEWFEVEDGYICPQAAPNPAISLGYGRSCGHLLRDQR